MKSILIVGAGPTGLTLALALKQRGISVRIIDSRKGPEPYSRALGIHSRTLEMLEKMGLLSNFLAKGLPGHGISFHQGEKKIDFSLKDLDAPYPFVLILPQSETEEILATAFKRLGGQIEWETSLHALEGQAAEIKLPGGEVQKEDYSWIVGCDGAHSAVRHSLNLSFTGAQFPETFLLADVQANTAKELDGIQLFLNKKGYGLVIPLPKNKTFRIVLPNFSKTDSLETELNVRGFGEILQITNINTMSNFQIQRRHVKHLRYGHIFLAGDAAHVHSPIGGQGMNTSIQDAFNLAWKLALVVDGNANENLLDSYEEERLPIAKMVLKGTTRITKLLTFSQKWYPPLFFRSIKLLLRSKKRRDELVKAISEIGVSYPNSSIIQEDPQNKNWKGPKAGERAPDLELKDGTRLFDRLKSHKHVILIFSNLDIGKFPADLVDVHVIKDEELRQLYLAENNTLYLIRPDGYIAYRSRNLDSCHFKAYLKSYLKS